VNTAAFGFHHRRVKPAIALYRWHHNRQSGCRLPCAEKKSLEELAGENLSGFIFKKNSPSSGMTRVKIFNAKSRPVKKGRGCVNID
jgi:uncharacterized protein YbbK (DUF523 family)